MTKILKAKLYSQTGEEKGEVKLDPEIFGVGPIKAALIQQAVVAQMANSRPRVAHTKNRGEVRGGGKKPWRQKGTGRARHGSIRSPLWRGGGITFGPNADRHYDKKINKKMKRRATLMVLSDRAENKAIKVLETLELKAAKTKLLKEVLEKLKLEKYTVIIIEKANPIIRRASQNLAKVKLLTINSLNIVDLLKGKNIVFTQDALKQLTVVFGKKAKA